MEPLPAATHPAGSQDSLSVGGERTDTEGTAVSLTEIRSLDPDCVDSFYWFDKYLLTVCPVPRHQESAARADPIPVLKTLTYVGTQALIKQTRLCKLC